MSTRPRGNPYPRVTALCNEIISTKRFPHVEVEDMLAVCRAESSVVANFRKCCDPLYKANWHALRLHSFLTEQAWLSVIQNESERNSGAIPKFRFETIWMRYALRLRGIEKISEAECMMMACSWGIAQQGAPYLVLHLPTTQWIPTLKAFIHDEKLQLLKLADNLEALLKSSNNDRLMAFTRYNAGPSRNTVSDYGHKVNKYRAQILQEKS